MLIVVGWGVSLRWGFGRLSRTWLVGIEAGVLAVRTDDLLDDPLGWKAWLVSPGCGLEWPSVNRYPEVTGLLVRVPLWMPLVLTAIPTAWLWHRDRPPPPPGHCQSCGYNLTGNVSGVCPECGERVGPVPPGKGVKG